jgi:hypothetical protein
MLDEEGKRLELLRRVLAMLIGGGRFWLHERIGRCLSDTTSVVRTIFIMSDLIERNW